MPSKLKEWQVTHTARTNPEEIAEELLRRYIAKFWPQMLYEFNYLGVELNVADSSAIVDAFKSADVMMVWREDEGTSG